MARGSAHGGEPIRCEGGCCRWFGRTTVAAARVRLYEASRGPIPRGSALEATCGDRRCVNLDHLRALRRGTVGSPRACPRGHERTGANVVRHRDGRIAYCRQCRNEQRRLRYRADAEYARRERDRQRRLRR